MTGGDFRSVSFNSAFDLIVLNFASSMFRSLRNLTALAFAMSNGQSISVAGSDASRVIDFVKSRDTLGLHGMVIVDICNAFSSVICVCYHVPRSANGTAHSLAEFGLVSDVSVSWIEFRLH